MSPSNSTKSHREDPTSYQQMQRALFKLGNDTSGSGPNETEATNTAQGPISSTNTTSQVSPKPNPKESNSTSETTGKTEAQLDTGSTPASKLNVPLLSQNQQKSSSQQSSEVSAKAETSQGFSDRVPLTLTLTDTKPIKPKPVVIGADSESKTFTTKTVSVPAPVVTTVPVLPKPLLPKVASTKPKGTARRRGKWTVEEEEYVARVIQDFNSGFLNAPAGYTLRSYLSDKLQCDPMRITKKFTGESCIGKRVFHPAVRSAANAAAIDKAQVRIKFCLVWFEVSLPFLFIF